MPLASVSPLLSFRLNVASRSGNFISAARHASGKPELHNCEELEIIVANLRIVSNCDEFSHWVSPFPVSPILAKYRRFGANLTLLSRLGAAWGRLHRLGQDFSQEKDRKKSMAHYYLCNTLEVSTRRRAQREPSESVPCTVT